MLVIAWSISASVGFGLSLSSAATAMIMPLWQYPHCGTSLSTQACCTLCSLPLAASPSIVVICLPAASLTAREQDRTALPSMWTVQAPHWAMPQPYLVPVRPMLSRMTHSSGVSGSTSTSCDVPLMVSLTIRLLLAMVRAAILVACPHHSLFQLALKSPSRHIRVCLLSSLSPLSAEALA